jgi:hypothetical protein
MLTPVSGGFVAFSGAVNATAVPAAQFISHGQLSIDCSRNPPAVSQATVAVRFWSGAVPADSGVVASPAAVNCYADRFQSCPAGARLTVNLPMSQLPIYFSPATGSGLFTSVLQNALLAFPARGAPNSTVIKQAGFSPSEVLPPATPADAVDYKVFLTSVCDACSSVPLM